MFGEGGARLWTHRFEFPLPDADYERAAGRRDVSFEAVDLDGDGAKEVLFLARAMSGTQSRLWAFDAGGAVRWVSPPVRPVTFGDTTYDPPFGVSRFIVTTGPDGRKAVWLSRIHNTWFPAVVQKLGPDGRVEGEYWQDGHTLFLGVGELGGRPVVLVGGTSNDLLGATLAVLDVANPSGCAPAVHPGYVCRDCPAGGPLKLLVFPKTELNDVLDGQRPWVTRVRPRPGGGWEVQVDVATYSGPEGIRYTAVAYYTLSPDFEPAGATFEDDYRRVHSLLEAAGLLRHHLGPEDLAQLWPVRSWDGRRFVDVRPHSSGQ